MKVKSFRGWIPSPACRQTLPGPPYDVISSSEARVVGEKNPDSVLHLNKPEIDLPKGTDAYSDIVYATGRENLQRFIEDGKLERDAQPQIYAYRQAKAGHAQTGFVALTAVADYASGAIKKHEVTVEKKERDRVRMVDTQNANVGPVYLAYKAREDLTAILDETVKTEPIFQIPCAECDETEHTIWRIDPANYERVIELFGTVDSLYICDGHHRSESAFKVGQRRIKEAEAQGVTLPESHPARWFLSVIFPHDQLAIFDYNRVIIDSPYTKAEVLAELEKYFKVESLGVQDAGKPDTEHSLAPAHHAKPTKMHEFGFYVEGEWFRLTLTNPVDDSHPIDSIDAEILTKLILDPFFGIKNLRTSEIIRFVGGDRGLHGMEKVADANRGKNACGFAVFPLTMEQLFKVADAGAICPPKSTYLLPKLLSGMVIRTIEEDTV
ncbi:Uncharacterized conserved protein UCP033563 [Carpediemonas membranifera]|uniref:Uncharacterized conserved protein UCP033563 n=1 Tax=Carpediemonas membranifera TaxID=201153 RepID=A0A8J6B4R2_9EUKA|nr:Uncharacterized conserved protein UCP033563 [Carpediemonas membranifera]|eukprot:KAG9392852.1 Uncharacterized conserved protein UCP033563 [Carpediemonas membranifera]